jgi:phosphohistidine phosphatase
MGDHRELILLRHAKAAWPDGVEDLRRPLAPRGIADAGAAGRELAREAPIDLVLRSPATRVAQTWALVGAELSPPPPAEVSERLYGARPPELLALVGELPATAHTVLLVGHNPDLSVLATRLSGVEVTLRTASIVRLTLSGAWSELVPGAAALAGFTTPRAG